MYIGFKYQFSVSSITNNWYQPWKTISVNPYFRGLRIFPNINIIPAKTDKCLLLLLLYSGAMVISFTTIQATILVVFTTLQWTIAVYNLRRYHFFSLQIFCRCTIWGNLLFQVIHHLHGHVRCLWSIICENQKVKVCLSVLVAVVRHVVSSAQGTSGNNKAIQSYFQNYQHHEAIINFLTTSDETCVIQRGLMTSDKKKKPSTILA